MAFDLLKKVLSSGSDEEKIAAFKSMRRQIADGEPTVFFDLAKDHVTDRNSDVRWQAIIVLGEYIPSGRRNEDIWNFIVQCCGIDDDMQDALATILLEHLLEYDVHRTIDRIKAAPPQKAAPLLDVLERCWQFGQPESTWRQVREILGAG